MDIDPFSRRDLMRDRKSEERETSDRLAGNAPPADRPHRELQYLRRFCLRRLMVGHSHASLELQDLLHHAHWGSAGSSLIIRIVFFAMRYPFFSLISTVTYCVSAFVAASASATRFAGRLLINNSVTRSFSSGDKPC